jgi:hypothetical protein
MSNRLLNAVQRTAAGIAILAIVTALQASSAQAGSIITSNCLNGFGYGYGFNYNRSYNNSYGAGAGGYYGGGTFGGTASGYYGGNASGYGGGSSSGYGDGGCVYTRRELVNPYVIHMPQLQNEQDITDAAARDRLWQARCRPVIRQDQFGVRRYHYAAPGCEYGKYE